MTASLHWHNGCAHPFCEAQRSKVWCSVLLGFITMFHGYYDFPLRMSFCKITESFSRVS